ncbi:MAG TPA: hypothetical protein VGH42_13340 [Verrucomicrobiae bacterium]|jgi:hypothetical protein
MSPIVETLILGVIGSVIGTFLFLFIDLYWRRLALPKLEDMVYRGARVDGRWEFTDKLGDNQRQVYTLEIIQHADSLTGTYTLCSDISEGLSTCSYAFTGYIADGFVIGTARPRDRNSIYHATFCLKVVEELDALALKGKHSAIVLDTNEIYSRDVYFKRKCA